MFFSLFEGVLDLDFGHTNSTKSLSKHLRRLCSTVSIVPDHIHEESEEFLVELEGIDLPQYVTISPSTSRIKIINERSKSITQCQVKRHYIL